MMASRPGQGRVASSNLACMQCFKSKCKCVSRPDGNGCERCHRLKKQCHPSDAVRKTANAQRRHSAAARIGDLESKVDSLVRLLSAVAQSSAPSATLHNSVREDDVLAGYEHILSRNDADGASSGTGTDNISSAGPDERFSSSPLSSSSSSKADSLVASLSPPCSGPDDPDLDTCLAIFRDQMLPSFSFIHIPADVTAHQLQQDRPFLLRAIIAVASPCTQQKLAHARELKRVLAQMAVVQNLSSLDLLQGLLVFIAWSYDQIFTPSGTLSRLVLLAMSLACDLRLDKPLPSDEHMIKPMVGGKPCEDNSGATEHWFVAEEQRAVLACYALSSIISIYFAQIDAMNWKPRMDESLRALETNNECPTADAAFAFQIRLQLLVQKAVQVREQREWEGAVSNPDLSAANLYIRSLQGQLQQLGESLPPALQQRGTLLMHMRYIELCLNETARTLYVRAVQGPSDTSASRRDHAGSHDNKNNNNNNNGDPNPNGLGFDRLDFSWRSVGAIKAWLELFFALPPAQCAGLSFIHMAQLARCLTVLYRLSTYATDPTWDCHMVRNTVDLLLVLDGVAEKLELTSHEAGERSPDDRFMLLSGMMRKFRSNAAAEMNQKPAMAETTTQPITSTAPATLDPNAAAAAGWLNSAEEAATGGSADSQMQTLLHPICPGDDAFLESIFGDFGAGWWSSV